jgi:hypothetical protein
MPTHYTTDWNISIDFAESEIKKGVSKDDFIKNTTIPGVTEWTGDGIQRPLGAAYEELAEKKTM